MMRKFTFGLVFALVAGVGSLMQAQEPGQSSSPFRTAQFSSDNAEIIQVRNGRRYGNRGYYNNRGYYYGSPYYRNRSYRPYNYGYYPRYYGTRNYGYYNYGRRGGGVQVGPFGVWW